MTQTIWKHDLAMQVRQYIQLPKDSLVLCVQMQHDKPRLWAMVDPDCELELFLIEIVGTGHEADNKLIYYGTFQVQDGDFIFHVFGEPRLRKLP